MKRLAIILLALMPAMLFAQYQVNVASNEPQTLKVSVPAYNERIPAAVMTMKFDFNPDKETLTVTMGSGGVASPNYDKVWLPQHGFSFKEMQSYMKTRGVKLKKAKTFVDQENFLNLGSKPVAASIDCQGMTFDGNYVIKSTKKVKKELDKQMVPLDGKTELCLTFKISNNKSNLKLTMHNPMPLHRSGRKATIDFMADDVTINIMLDRCKESRQMLATVNEYVEIFTIGENKLKELKRNNRSLMGKVATMLVEQYAKIDVSRFQNSGCAEIDEKYEELDACYERIKEYVPSSKPRNDDDGDKKPKTTCDVNALNNDIKSTTTKLNNLVNAWSMASTPSEKAEKKASFDATVKSFDAKLNGLPSDCKKKLDSKLLKNYEFVKKLIK